MKIQKLTTAAILVLFALSGCSGGGSDGPKSCASSDECEAGEFCSFVDLSCGNAGATGQCELVPASCTLDSAPVCSCDRLTFVNECWAAQDSQSLRAAGECP